ncbi:MAG: AI-2E family transporter [Novosphingobium sp.]|nr:AI-2E family transporter [Novosphingobium sp.]
MTIALIVGAVLCFRIVEPFIPSLVWSLTLAVLLAPLEKWLRRQVRSPGLSVSITLVIGGAMLVAPVFFVSRALVNEIIGSVDLIGSLLTGDHWQQLERRQPWLTPLMEWVTRHLDLPQLLNSATNRLGEWSAGFLQGSVTSVINLLLTFYFLFYLLRDETFIRHALARTMPLNGQEFRMLADRVVNTIYASVYGTVAVALLQGFLAGLMFWFLELPSPVFWGVIMGLLAIVPFLGAFIVWVPACVLLALNGQWVSAVVLALWGTIVVGLIDNVIYPILVGRQLAMHSMLSFIAIVGGLILVGAHGIILGPLIVAVTLALLEIWRSRLDVEQSPPPAEKV